MPAIICGVRADTDGMGGDRVDFFVSHAGADPLAFGCESVLARVPRGVLRSGDVAWLLLRCWAGFCGGSFVTFGDIGV